MPELRRPAVRSRRGKGRFETVETAVADLFAGKLDELQCDLCKKPTGAHPAIAVVREEMDALWLVPGNVWDEPAFAERLKKMEAAFGQVPERLLDCDALRERLGALLRSRLETLQALFSADDTVNYLEQRWREFTPAIFSAYMIALSELVPGVDVASFIGKDREKPRLADLLVKGADIQAQVWKSLCVSWMWEGAGPHGETFEEDLRRYIDRSFLIKGARRRFDDFANSVNRPGIPANAIFIVEAARASLYAFGEQANPATEGWTEIYFEIELWLRRQLEQQALREKALIISDDRAQKTIPYRAAYDAVVRRLQQLFNQHDRATSERFAEVDRLRAVAGKAGFPQLVEEVQAQSIKVQGADGFPLEKLAAAWLQVVGSLPPGQANAILPDWHAALLVREGRLDDLEALADIVLKQQGGDRKAQATVEAWLGRYLKEARQPRRLLDRIGTEPRPWERDLPPDTLVDLWVERSNALRLVGQANKALQAAQDALPLVANQSAERQLNLRHNIAILQRETGSPDAALIELKALLAETPTGSKKQFVLLESLIVTHVTLGQIDEALSAVEQALPLATGPLARQRSHLNTSRASLLIALSRRSEAAQTLMAIDEPSDDPRAAIGEAAAWVRIFAEEPALFPIERLERVGQTLLSTVQKARTAGDMQVYLNGLHLGALLTEYAENATALLRWICGWVCMQHMNSKGYSNIQRPSSGWRGTPMIVESRTPAMII